jgi:hypothetical protein
MGRILRVLYIEGKTRTMVKLPEGSEGSILEPRLDYYRPPGTQHARRNNKKGPRQRQWYKIDHQRIRERVRVVLGVVARIGRD